MPRDQITNSAHHGDPLQFHADGNVDASEQGEQFRGLTALEGQAGVRIVIGNKIRPAPR